MSSIRNSLGPISDWSSSPTDAVSTDNQVGSQAPSTDTGPQAPTTEDDNSVATPTLVAPKKAEASLDASAMKATVNAIPINQPASQKRDYAAEAKANWDASTSPKEKWEAAQQPLPPLKQFVGPHEKAVQEAAQVFDAAPGAALGRHIAEFITGSDASSNKIDRSEKSREISRDILKEGVSHFSGEAMGEFAGEAIGQVAGKTAGIVSKEVVGHFGGDAVGDVADEAAKHIAGDAKAE